METVDTRITSLEKRMEKHGIEIDVLEERVHNVESNQKLFKLQLQELIEIKDGIKEINKNLTSMNDVVIETKHKLEMVDRDHSEYKAESKEKIINLEKQRNIDHNIKPLEKWDKYQTQVISIIIAAIVGMVIGRVGLQ